MTCTGYLLDLGAPQHLRARIHCPGCAEAEKLRAELEAARAELEAERRSLTWERDAAAATRARLGEAVRALETLRDLPGYIITNSTFSGLVLDRGQVNGIARRALASTEPAAPPKEPRAGWQTEEHGAAVWTDGKPLIEESAAPAVTAPRMEDARIYPCDDCGLMRSKAEGGTTFTVCDACWEKHFGKPRAAAPAQEVAPPVTPRRGKRIDDASIPICENCDGEGVVGFGVGEACFACKGDGRAAPPTAAPALPVCLNCDAGFPVQDGVHYGTQRLGMISNTPCDAALPTGMKEPVK